MAKRHTADETSESNRNNVPLAPETNVLVNSACDRWGISKTELVKRLVGFFSAAPPSVQQTIVGVVPEDMREEFREKVLEFFSSLVKESSTAQGTRPQYGGTKKG